MYNSNKLSEEGSVPERYRDPTDAYVVEETPTLEATVELEIQAKVDCNHPDVNPEAMTLEAEERMVARELEIGRTRERLDRSQESTREAECRTDVEAQAATLEGVWEPQPDPREKLSREELGKVNEKAAKIHSRIEHGSSRAAIARQLAERVADGGSVLSAIIAVSEAERDRPGTIVPIASLKDVQRREVSIQGRVKTLWEPAHPSIQQVGLIEDETGTTKFTSWVRSNAKMVEEGELVRMRNVAKNWYQGRVSVAVTGWSRLIFPERGRWWEQ
ncbi:DNA-binding protein [Haloarchaeobius amylolyticus]|uniref:DNA-binding protein n=2 Tax=Haloarchaeobius amylolyticus TaxID=1198296 RepID=UPI00226FF471|nr:DNA-binding protein [Haloarchaeobius amylolyticus]